TTYSPRRDWPRGGRHQRALDPEGRRPRRAAAAGRGGDEEGNGQHRARPDPDDEAGVVPVARAHLHRVGWNLAVMATADGRARSLHSRVGRNAEAGDWRGSHGFSDRGTYRSR